MEEISFHSRRLTDKLLTCISMACDLCDVDTARDLLSILENLIKKPKYNATERRNIAISTVETHERIWMLRHKISQQNSDNPRG